MSRPIGCYNYKLLALELVPHKLTYNAEYKHNYAFDIPVFVRVRCSSMVRAFAHARWVDPSRWTY